MSVQDNYFRNHLIAVAFSLLVLMFLGVIGYMRLEGWNWLDALYMTFISFSTVGYRELAPLSLWGRVFTMVIILIGMVVIAMLSATVTSWFVRNELLSKRKILKMKKEIQKMKNHIILCGAGDTGRTIIEEFRRARKEFVVIEEKEETVAELRARFPDLYIISGDATKDEILLEANIKEAQAIITALSLDADNLFVVVSSRTLNPNILIISRAVNAGTESKLYSAGANYVISPNIVEGMRMASVILRPTVVSFLEVMIGGEGLALRMEEIDIPEDSPFVNKSLREVQIPQRTGLIVLAVKRGSDSQWQFNPSSNYVLSVNDRIIILGEPEKIDKLQEILKNGILT